MVMQLFSSNFYILFYYFALYSFSGWCIEVIYAFYENHRFVNRGFLYGPLCPMYGFGALILIVILKPAHHSLITFFILAFVLISALEYFTGFLLEKAFNTIWWDYSNDFLNIKGRVCLLFSILWGIGSVIFIRFIHPLVTSNTAFISTKRGTFFLNFLFFCIIVDFIATLFSIVKLNYILSQIYDIYMEIRVRLDALKENKAEITSNYESILNELKGRYDSLFEKLQNKYSRLLNAFPSFTIKKINLKKQEIINRIKLITRK